jgi:hypothetical protein
LSQSRALRRCTPPSRFRRRWRAACCGARRRWPAPLLALCAPCARRALAARNGCAAGGGLRPEASAGSACQVAVRALRACAPRSRARRADLRACALSCTRLARPLCERAMRAQVALCGPACDFSDRLSLRCSCRDGAHRLCEKLAGGRGQAGAVAGVRRRGSRRQAHGDRRQNF